MKRRGLWAAAICLALVLLTPLLAHAAPTPNGLQVRPVRAYPTQDPGSTTNGSLTVTNYTDEPQRVLFTTETFQTNGEDYSYKFGSEEAAKWVKFAEPDMTLAPKESRVSNYTIAVPANATPGGKYIALISSVSTAKNDQAINEVRRVASLVYLQVNGAITKTSQLVSFDANNLAAKPSVNAAVRINNSGNTHFQSRVGFYVNRWPFRGNGTYNTQVEGFILPGTIRQLTTEVKLPQSPGIYRITAEYAAPEGPVKRLTQTVIYIPMWSVIAVVLLLCGLIWATIRFWPNRPKLRKKSKKTTPTEE